MRRLVLDSPCSIRGWKEHETNPTIRFQSYLSGRKAAAQSAVVSTESPSTAGNRTRIGFLARCGYLFALNRAYGRHGHTAAETWPVSPWGRSGVSGGAGQSATSPDKKENDSLPFSRAAVFFLPFCFSLHHGEGWEGVLLFPCFFYCTVTL